MKPSTSAKGFKISVTKDNLGGSTPVPPGIYKARVSMEQVVAKSGTPMAKVVYSLLGNGPDGKSVANRKAFDNITIEESMVWKLNTLYKACTGDDLPQESFTQDELFLLVKNVAEGHTVSVELTTEVYNDKENNKVKNIFA